METLIQPPWDQLLLTTSAEDYTNPTAQDNLCAAQQGKAGGFRPSWRIQQWTPLITKSLSSTSTKRTSQNLEKTTMTPPKESQPITFWCPPLALQPWLEWPLTALCALILASQILQSLETESCTHRHLELHPFIRHRCPCHQGLCHCQRNNYRHQFKLKHLVIHPLDGVDYVSDFSFPIPNPRVPSICEKSIFATRYATKGGGARGQGRP